MIKLYNNGVYLLNGVEMVEDNNDSRITIAPEEATKNTIAYNILKAHNTSSNMERLEIKFDKLTSHDITFVGIIQTARASGLER
ncbi:MAG: hydratase, partial [Lachnospiraceae bacterium]|nr:hydratase [Lachnospiraceae bacterium]